MHKSTEPDLRELEEELVTIELADALCGDSDTPHFDPNDKWCVYLCVHPVGFYYYGKGLTKNVLAGSYKGSGTSLRASWIWYPKDEWVATPLETFPEQPLNENGKDPGELAAYQREKDIISFDMLCDPFCMNDVPGGKGGYTWGQVSSRAVEKRKKAVSDSWNDPVVRERHRLGAVERWSTLGAREKHRDIVRHSWAIKKQSEEFLEQVEKTALLRANKALVEKERKKLIKAETNAKAKRTISEKAIERAAKKREEKFRELSPQFTEWVSKGIYTKSNVLDVKKTLTALGAKVPNHVMQKFLEWLDQNQIVRWGGPLHKEILQQKITTAERAAEARRQELSQKIEKTYKMKDSSREKMKLAQLSHPKKQCDFCGESFRPACYGRYHGLKCKNFEGT